MQTSIMNKLIIVVKFFLTIVLSLWLIQGFGQSIQSRGASNKLVALSDSLNQLNEKRRKRVQEYLSKTGETLFFNKNGSTYAIKDIDRSGNPIYIKTTNEGAAITTGANHLQIQGSLGLDLDGSGVGLAIWDGGKVRDTHQEFDGRVIPSDGATENNSHATHVTGTILANGINSFARGMAVNASARTFDFLDDDSEMGKWLSDDKDGIILSNHSYGTVSGWDDGSWFGDASVSELEDYKFGFYDGGAAIWDQLAYVAPYYSIVKSAGNDRGDSGEGIYPPDGPYDIIATTGTAKNIFTIGAVSKVPDYVGPEDVLMSSFSSWGPTDDGRIKPDFVAAGVGVLSTFDSSDDDYGLLQGTSMSAPNVTGSLALLQQLYSNLNGGNYMKSALLKALAIHTIKEAGTGPGPDYKFGWGLLDARDAANFLIEENSHDRLILPIEIFEGGDYVYEFTPVKDSKVIATLVWTDVPGSPPQVQLDPNDLILVNDLDLRVSDQAGMHMPWILDPSNPGANATLGDNFRDNVEKIEFISDGSQCTLQVTHKNSVTHESQQAFLLISYQSVESPPVLYWVGESDNAWSNSSNWSTESGGVGGTALPSAESTVVFDNNSFEEENGTLSLTSDVTVSSFVWLTTSVQTIDLNTFKLEVRGNISIGNNLNIGGHGEVVIVGNGRSDVLDLALGDTFRNTAVIFDDKDAKWNLLGKTEIHKLVLRSGSLTADDIEINVGSLICSEVGHKSLEVDHSVVTFSSEIDFGVLDKLSDVETIYRTEETSIHFQTDEDHDGSLFIDSGSQLTISGNGRLESVQNMGTLTLGSNFAIHRLQLEGGSQLTLNDSRRLTLTELVVNSGAERVTINSLGHSAILLDGHRKICLKNIDVADVDRLGQASVTVGANGTVINSSGWRQDRCEDLLFADFSYDYNCLKSYVYFNNLSSGNITSYHWDFGDGNSSSEASPTHQFLSEDTYDVKLRVSDEIGDQEFEQTIDIGSNSTFKSNEIIENSTSLVSLNVADAYQWFRDGGLLEGETDRVFVHNNYPGTYFVVTFSGECNSASESYDLIILNTKELSELNVHPNPSPGVFTLEGEELERDETQIFTISGQRLSVPLADWNGRVLNLTDYPTGIYIIYHTKSSQTLKIMKL